MAKVEKLNVSFNGDIIKSRKVYLSVDLNNLFQKSVKKIYCNDELIWQNSNAFIFIQDLNDIDLTTLSEDTLVFVNFGNNFTGNYDIIESLEEDNLGTKGQMVVLETTEGDENK